MPTVGVSTYSFWPDATARAGLEFALRHGFHGLELGSYTYWPQAIDAGDRRYIRLLAAAHGVDLSVHFIHRGAAPASHDPERRARHLNRLDETLDLARDIGARVVVVHPGPVDCPNVAPHGTTEAVRREAMANLKDFLRAVAPKAEEAGVVVCVETRNDADPEGNVLRSRDHLKNLLGDAAR